MQYVLFASTSILQFSELIYTRDMSRHGGTQLYPPDTAYPGSQSPVRFRRTRTSTLASPVRLLGRFPWRRRPPGPRPLCLYPLPYPGHTGTGTDTRHVPWACSGLLGPVRSGQYPYRHHASSGTDTWLVTFASRGLLGIIVTEPRLELALQLVETGPPSSQLSVPPSFLASPRGS